MDYHITPLLEAIVPVLWIGSVSLLSVAVTGLALKWEPESFRLVSPR